MFYLNSAEWSGFLDSSLKNLTSMAPVPYTVITPSILPEKAGIYLISEVIEGIDIALYVGRSKNLRNRIYRNHLMGDVINARLKKYIIQDPNHTCFGDKIKAKVYLRTNCMVRWILEEDVRKRGALESYFTARLFPKYGISEEH